MGLYDGGCFTQYEDSTSWGAEPHDTPDYHEITKRLGYPTIMAYCISHEVCHHIVSEIAFNRRSVVIWPLAHGLPVSLQRAVGEEALTMTLQRWVMRDERPIIGDVDWWKLKQATWEALDGLYAS